jgi:hypothetical protein
MSAMSAAQRRSARTPEEIRRNRLRRLPFLGAGLAFFVAALYGGLWRLGYRLPHAERLGEWHGPLMICGFFGALIGLERAVALGGRWIFAAPLLACAGALALVAGAPLQAAAALFVLASAVLTAASLAALRGDRELFTAVLAAGAASWGVGAGVWLVSGAVSAAAPWWLMFLVLTIAAERLDASRSVGVGRVGLAAFLACLALMTAGAARGLFAPAGAALLGAGFVGLGAWLLRHDIALKNFARAPHLSFFGLSMAAGYLWLALAGLAPFAAPPYRAPFGYDLVLHAVLIGFVLSMAIGHSVIVIPAITGAQAPYHPAMYVGLSALHASVALRAGSDLLAWAPGRMASGPLTILGLAAFAAVLGRQIARARRGL